MSDDFDSSDNNSGPPVFELDTPAGATIRVVGDEKGYYEGLAARYMADNSFTNITDLQDLDRLLAMETIVWRWQNWLSQEVDYWNSNVDPEIKKHLKDMSGEIRLLKKHMNLDKLSRDRSKEESIVGFIDNLKQRALEFTVTRNEEAVKAITLIQELIALVTLYDNTTTDERRDLDVEAHDVMGWIREVAIPEFTAIDTAFRERQKYWIQDL